MTVTTASTARQFYALTSENRFDVVVIDMQLPDASGIDLCIHQRRLERRTAIILCSSESDEVDRILGLELGADDYMLKPVSPRELTARIRAVLRRAELGPIREERSVTYRFNGFLAGPAPYVLLDPHGASVDLTSAEFELLRAFLDLPGKILTRGQLRGRGLTPHRTSSDRSVDVLVSRLRRKLAVAGGGDLFRTVRNAGYIFAADVVRNGVAQEVDAALAG